MSENDAIRELVQVYFDCMYESDADKAHLAFHPDARVVGYMGGKLQDMAATDFASFVASQQPSAKDKGEPAVLEVLSCDIAGDTAVVRVRDDYLGMTFLDTLSLLKLDGQWRIYNKLYHIEAGP